MARDVCDRHADMDADRLALIYVSEGAETRFTFGEIARLSKQLANLLTAKGVTRGDRVAILLPQCAETAFAHVACYRMGAIALPLFVLFGPDALQYRLENGEAKVLITDAAPGPCFL